MTRNALRPLLLMLLTLPLAGCAVVGGIFKAGMVTAILVVVALVLVIGFIARSFGGRRPPG